jgi:FkbM family methyltransferase
MGSVSRSANWIRPRAIAAIRVLPKLRGRGRLAGLLNKALLAAGADPVAVARMEAGHSLLVDCRLFSHSMFLFNGVVGIEELLTGLLAFLKPDGVALDVGANIGAVTVPLALAARRVGSRVIAFEPFSRNIEWNNKNLRLNQIEDVVTIVESGLSSEPGEAILMLGGDFLTGATVGNAAVAEPGDNESWERVTIRLNTLDDLWPTFGNPRLDCIKIDIEGHEDRFLEGAKQTLAMNRPAILMEVNRYWYERRGVDFDTVIPQGLPPDYRFLTSRRTEIKSLADCHHSDVLLVPAEKVSQLQT